MNENNFKEVFFDKYCVTCKHEKLTEEDEPCCDCLEEPVNEFSHKPVLWEDKNK